MIDAETIDATSTIPLLEALETAYPLLAMIHVSRQCEVSSRQAGTGVAGSAGVPDQAALRSGVLSAFEPHRAIMGCNA
jgi:hypothetical protein